jgi:hypothetical protein
MKNPRWKSGGVLNVVCGWCLGTYGKLLLKYKYNNDYRAFCNGQHLTANYQGVSAKNSHKVTFENIRRQRGRK